MFQLINGTIECGIKPKSTYKHGVHDGNRKEWKPGKPGVRKPGVRLSNLVRKPGVRLSNLANLADFLITPVRGNLWRGDQAVGSRSSVSRDRAREPRTEDGSHHSGSGLALRHRTLLGPLWHGPSG